MVKIHPIYFNLEMPVGLFWSAIFEKSLNFMIVVLSEDCVRQEGVQIAQMEQCSKSKLEIVDSSPNKGQIFAQMENILLV